MCGINGLVFLKGVERSEFMMNKIRYVFNELLVESQDRGHHATGIASFKRDGSFDFYKKAQSSSEMVATNKEYLDIISNLDPNESSVIISHTRWFTKGLPSNNKNNHPFNIGNIIGIHNGSVKNDDMLFKKFEFKREGEVDSEIIFQLINHYNQDEITYKGLESALEKSFIRGLFALAFVHKNNTSLLHLVKQEKPMSLAYWKEAGVIIFNSDEAYIKNTFDKLKRVGYAFSLKSVDTCSLRKVKDNTYFTVNADATTLEEALSEPKMLYLESSSKNIYTDDYGYYDGYTGSCGTTNSCGSVAKKSRGKNSTKKQVTAQDSKGVVLRGEVDSVTGEVIIFSDYDKELDDKTIKEADRLLLGMGEEEVIEEELCFECGEYLLTEEKDAHYNANNPTGEKVCSHCYNEVLANLI